MTGKSYETDFIKLPSLSHNKVLHTRAQSRRKDQVSAGGNGVAFGSRFALATSDSSTGGSSTALLIVLLWSSHKCQLVTSQLFEAFIGLQLMSTPIN